MNAIESNRFVGLSDLFSSVLFVAGMTLWEDLTQSELDAKFLFPDSTISTDNCGFQTQGVQGTYPTKNPQLRSSF
jgi:hypothetical protein